MNVFRWNDWNLQHATKHGCRVEEIEAVVRRQVRANAQRKAGDGKWIVTGRGRGDRMIEVIFVPDEGDGDTLYVIHAMPVTRRRKR